jgi:WS/DGAT/MGAT family acyltransferase
MTPSIQVDGADAAWLRMDHPTNRMVIVAVLMFDGRVSLVDMRALVAGRLLRFDRFRCRVASDGGSLRWEEDEAFDLDRHVVPVELSGAGDESALKALVGDLMSASLPEDRPPWQFGVVERFGEGSAIIVRLHHGIADGIALIRVLLSLADGAGTPGIAESPPGGENGSFVGSVARGVVSTVETIVEEGVGMILEPDRAFSRLRQGLGLATALGKFALVGPDSPSPFRGPLTTTKRVAWSESIDLREVKRAARRLGATVNDIVLSALAGGLGRFMAGRGRVERSTELRVVVPVNLRPDDEPLSLGNRFGLVLLALPVGIEDPVRRTAEVSERMQRIKQSMEPVVALGILQTIGSSPKALQDTVIRTLSASSTAVMTNVPGPRERLSFAGRPLRKMMFWVPRAGSIGLGISIMSYAGEVLLGFAVDAGLVSEPELLARAFEDEWARLAAAR